MAPPLLSYLEQEIVFPILNASLENFADRSEKLASAQENLIDMLRDYFYPCTTPAALSHAVAITTLSPNFRKVWTDLQHLGFSTPLDEPTHTRLRQKAS
jgi:hypothetical protein